MDKLTQEVVPILVLVAVIAIVVARLPRVDVGHTPEFLRRRMLNWLPLGLTYAFLYMGRYNMTVLKTVGGINQRDFGNIDFWGSLIYGVSFLLNGPLADRFGGRRTILAAAGGALVANALIGFLWMTGRIDKESSGALMLLFSLNMYFQSFGAVSIVKVNASWFHLRERGTFGGIFGILISLGLYFAFDWGMRIAVTVCPSCDPKIRGGVPLASETAGLAWLFLVPAAILVVFWVLSFLFVRDTPGDAGQRDFDVADASSGETVGRESSVAVISRMLRNPIILTIAFIELCSGFLRQGILKWSPDFARAFPGAAASYINAHWGMVSCIAGITGGMFAGVISDHLFHSRRPPMSSVLYLIMLVGAIAMLPLLGMPVAVSWIIAFMAMAIIGVHGMLSGVASQDFGGRLHTGVAVGLIDGFVYLGTAIQDQVYGGYGHLLPEKGDPLASSPETWRAWPIAMIPVAAIGLALSLRIWHARVHPRAPVAAASRTAGDGAR